MVPPHAGPILALLGFIAIAAIPAQPCTNSNTCISNSTCLLNGTCVNQTCSFPFADSTVRCDDGSSLTRNDKCVKGECTGTCVLSFDGQCVSSCPEGFVKDSDLCAELKPECGADCIACASDQTKCARCSSTKFLDNGVCSDECQKKQDDGSNDYELIFSPFSRVCVESSSGSSSDSLSTQTLIIIIVCGVVGCCILAVVIYICCDKWRQGDFLMPDDDNSYAMKPVNSQSVVLNLESPSSTSDGPTHAWGDPYPSSSSDKWQSTLRRKPESEDQWKKTLRRLDKGAKNEELETDIEELPPHLEEQVKATPIIEMSTLEANEFHAKLKGLRKDKNAFILMLREMKRRQESKHDSASRAKYDTLITDITRLLRLFQVAKNERKLPVDGLQLLEWGERTLRDYLGSQATLSRKKTMARR
eukprot:m.127936 g.127936  ORF g.127936 m.127936 type:complete len:417 (-) comp23566_c0_seq3:38-1288(-)